jgi:PAS domain S-box-containing protein
MNANDQNYDEGSVATKLERDDLQRTRPDPASLDALAHIAALVDLFDDAICAWDRETGITEWNRGAERLYGFSRQEAIGKKSHEMLKTSFPGPFEEYDSILARDGFWSGELIHTRKDGLSVVVESRQRMIEADGRQMVLEINRDISDRKSSESILQRYRLLYEKSRDVIWFLDAEGHFVEVNQAAIDLYGYSREEFLSMSIRDVRHQTTLGDLARQFENAYTTGVHFETTHVKADGTEFSVDVNANGADFGNERLVLAIVRDISDRKESENALRASEERRKLAQEAGRVGIWDWDARTDATYWSETMRLFYDDVPQDQNPHHDYWLTHLHPSDRERVDIHVKQTLQSKEERFRDEFRIIKKDGTIRWLESIAQVVRDDEGRPIRMYGVNLDITERKDTEQRIRLSENQLRLVTNAVPALISYVDSSERYRFVNQQFHEWIGLAAEDVIGKSVRDVFDPTAYKIVKPRIDQALSGQQVTFETTLNYQAAGQRFVHVSYMPDIGVDGTVYGYYGLTNDLTELKRSEELLRSTEERMAMMVENVTDYAIFSTDQDGRIDNWNTGAELIFGYTSEEILGRYVETVFAPEDVEREVPQSEMKLARQKGRSSSERWYIKKDGTRFYASSVMMALYLGEKLTGYAAIAVDLTEKQRRAEELQRAHDELEVRVKERTRALAEANLALIQEMEVREVAERQRVELLGRLVNSQEVERRRIARDLHDQLGQRLTALRLKIASLKEISTGHEEISRRVERLQQIGEALDSEVSFLAWELRPSALDERGLVEAVGAFVHEWSRHYEVPAEFHAAGLTKTRLEKETETHLYRIAQEALTNIIKHAEATMVTVVLERRDAQVVLIIEDNGKGFDGSELRPSPDAEGGYGLVGMKERAYLAGGEFEVESAAGRGTTIYVRVPVAE